MKTMSAVAVGDLLRPKGQQDSRRPSSSSCPPGFQDEDQGGARAWTHCWQEGSRRENGSGMRKSSFQHPEMGDSNGRLDSPMSTALSDSISPPSLKEGRSERHDIFSRSENNSPLLGTEPLPMDDHTSCPYCHKGFRKPRVLDCLHSMCEDCIIAQLDGRREAQKAFELAQRADPNDCELETPKMRERPTPPGVIRCPMCSQESHVGNDVRYVHTMLLDYVRYNENEDPRQERRCRSCKSDQSAVAFCRQCQADLCPNCLNAHGLMRMFDGHEALTYKDLEVLGERKDVRTVVCPHHGQPYKVLCATCETLACKTCLDIEHLQHKVIEVGDKVVKAITNEIQNLADNVEKQWTNSLSEWSAIPDRNASLHEQYENARARLDMHFESLVQALEEAKNRKIKELEDTRHRQEQQIEDLYRKMNLNESRVNDALSFTRHLLEQANGMELVASRRKVVQQLNNLNHTMPALGIQVELEFQPMAKRAVDQNLNQIGGSIVGRMVSGTPGMKESLSSSQMAPSLVEQQPLQQQMPQPLGVDWPRLNGNSASQGSLPAIGTERKKASIRSSVDGFGPWPPSSNPPDLPAISPPLLGKDMTLPGPIGPPSIPLNTSMPPLHPTTAAAIYNNYQWPPSSNPPHNGPGAPGAPTTPGPIGMPPSHPMQMLAARQQQLAALMLQNNGLNNMSSLNNTSNSLLMQARMRGMVPTVDPLLSALSNLTMGGPMASSDGPGMGTRTSPQESQVQRITELKIHSVFGTSQSGTSIRELHCPSGFCLSETDDILIADTNNHRVVVCGPPSPWKIGRPGTEDGMLCFPRKVIALKGDVVRYVVLDKGADGKTRAQMFDARGEFLKRINLAPIVPRGGIEVSAATCTSVGHLVLVDTNSVVYCIDVDQTRVVYWFDASAHVGEASDVAVYEKMVYITDFKNHCVQVFGSDGMFVRKLGEPSQTPYPIGIDISKNGDILVADTHGNHLHVVVFNAEGGLVQSFTHNEFRLSRCVGLRVAGSGHIVTLCKHNHTLFVFKPLYIR